MQRQTQQPRLTPLDGPQSSVNRQVDFQPLRLSSYHDKTASILLHKAHGVGKLIPSDHGGFEELNCSPAISTSPERLQEMDPNEVPYHRSDPACDRYMPFAQRCSSTSAMVKRSPQRIFGHPNLDLDGSPRRRMHVLFADDTVPRKARCTCEGTVSISRYASKLVSPSQCTTDAYAFAGCRLSRKRCRPG